MKRKSQWALAGALFVLMAVAPAEAQEYDGPTIMVHIEVDCDNRDEATDHREPIRTWWEGSYTVGATDEFEVTIQVNDVGTGEVIGVLEHYGLTTKRHHDSWFGPQEPIDGRTIWAGVYVRSLITDGSLHLVSADQADCPLPKTGLELVPVAPAAPKPPELERYCGPSLWIAV